MTHKVKYHRISFDWDISDGTYTPTQLRKARLRALRWGRERTYTLDITPTGTTYAGDIPLEFTRSLRESDKPP
jgi:hypothetical protein